MYIYRFLTIRYNAGRPGSPSLELITYITLVDIRVLVTLFPDFPLVLLIELVDSIVRPGHPVIKVFFLGVCLSLILVCVVPYFLKERTYLHPRPQISQVELYPRPTVLRLVQMNVLMILISITHHCSRAVLPIYTTSTPRQVLVTAERKTMHRHHLQFLKVTRLGREQHFA